MFLYLGVGCLDVVGRYFVVYVFGGGVEVLDDGIGDENVFGEVWVGGVFCDV